MRVNVKVVQVLLLGVLKKHAAKMSMSGRLSSIKQ